MKGTGRLMKLDYKFLKQIEKEYGETFYILDTEQFKKNYLELKETFEERYSNFCIAYSYKTNYIPRLCKMVDDLGGYAEVVSDMEYELAKRIGVEPQRIIFNGPYKDQDAVRELLLAGGTVNIDSKNELKLICKIAEDNVDKTINVGIRCNFPINDNLISRFGIDTNTSEIDDIISSLKHYTNINLNGLHCHFATRDLNTWQTRTEGIISLVEEKLDTIPERIDLGGGLYGKMGEELKRQFDSYIPSYVEYAEIVANEFAQKYSGIKPMLFIEPGSALVGDVMKFASKVVSIKNIRGKYIATLLGSIYNINPTLNKKNPPINVYHNNDSNLELFNNIDFGGFTCIESDYLYRNYTGKLAVEDYIVFDNVGSYSIVLKPPFILPNFSVLEYDGEEVRLIKRKENFDDIFHTYSFEFN